MAELGNAVWSHEGIIGTPVGSAEFVQRLSEERIAKEEQLWQAIPWVPDLQSGWQILLQCASPRCHHFLRTLPPSQSAWFAGRLDSGMMETMEEILGGLPGDEVQKGRAKEVATMPMRLGGLGLRSAARMAPAAFGADALPMISNRLPEVANRVTVQLTNGQNLDGCLQELGVASDQMDRHWFRGSTHLGRLTTRGPPTRCRFNGARRVATRLATSRVFFFRVPLPGNRDVCPIVRLRHGSSALAFWPRSWRCVPRISHHQSRVRGPARTFPNVDFGEVTCSSSRF